MSIKRMNRSGVALANFVTYVEFNPTFRPVILGVRPPSHLRICLRIYEKDGGALCVSRCRALSVLASLDRAWCDSRDQYRDSFRAAGTAPRSML